MILSEDTPNLIRQKEFDYIKALAIVAMVIIHVYESWYGFGEDVLEFSIPWLENILQFVAGPLAAPVFMFAMGVGTVYSKNRQPDQLMLRGLKIFLMGYVLNFLREGIIELVCILIFRESIDLTYGILNVDILQFAGLSLLLIGFLKKRKVPVLAMAGIAVGMLVFGRWVTAFLPAPNEGSMLYQCLVGLFFFTGFPTAFPLFLWFVYPAAGVVFAKYLRHINNLDQFYTRLFFASGIGLAAYVYSLTAAGVAVTDFFYLANEVYYQQTFLSLIFTLLTVCVEISVMHFLCKWIHVGFLERFGMFLSRNLNTIYIVQWVIIGWLYMPVYFLVEEFQMIWSIPIGLAILAITVLLTRWIVCAKAKKAAEKARTA